MQTLKRITQQFGDWVAIKIINGTEAIIYAVLPRKSYFARKLAISGGRKMKNGILIGGKYRRTNYRFKYRYCIYCKWP